MTDAAPDTDTICQEAGELLLASMSKTMGVDGLRSAFMFGRPGAPIFQRSLGIEIFSAAKPFSRPCSISGATARLICDRWR